MALCTSTGATYEGTCQRLHSQKPGAEDHSKYTAAGLHSNRAGSTSPVSAQRRSVSLTLFTCSGRGAGRRAVHACPLLCMHVMGSEKTIWHGPASGRHDCTLRGDGARGTALTQRRTPFPAVWRSPAERRSPANPVLACKFQRFEHGAAALRPFPRGRRGSGPWPCSAASVPGRRERARGPVVKKRPKEIAAMHSPPAC